jgi:hypothetical protein
MPMMRMTRPWPYHGRVYQPGASADFPEETCQRMEAGRPPFGVRVEEAELEQLTEPEPAGPTADDFTSSAIDAMIEADVELADYDGPSSGKDGKVLKSDVVSWLTDSTPSAS